MSGVRVSATSKKQSHSQAMLDRETNSSNNDPVIGLNVCGKLYYCHQSTLVNISPYFASRLEGEFDSSVAYTDPQGHNVYFVERPPTTFHYIFEFIVSGGCHELPSFQENPALVRNLRMEAEFFGLESLAEKLKVTKSIVPQEGNQGVLYWLGTKKGTEPYQNPHKIGAVRVGGWMEDEANEGVDNFHFAHPFDRRSSFVHYQELPGVDLDEDNVPRIEVSNCLLWCDHAAKRLPVVLELKSLSLRPTHYSLRTSTCFGMRGIWKFEGSKDGTTWKVLHLAINDQNLRTYLPPDTLQAENKNILQAKLELALGDYAGEEPEEVSDEGTSKKILELLENEFRHTWELSPAPTDFYQFFRIIGAGKHEGACRSCLHGEGIELFGDIYEE